MFVLNKKVAGYDTYIEYCFFLDREYCAVEAKRSARIAKRERKEGAYHGI